MNSPTTTAATKWPIADLKPHPDQAALFAQPTPEEVMRLATDIQQNSLLQPIEILPDGTIICGHTRVEAAMALEWTEIDAIVRDDLAKQGRRAILNRLIDDNQNRRQMSLLEMAKCVQMQIERSLYTKSGEYTEPDKATKSQMAAKLGLHPKKLQRLLRILTTPKEVQDAFSKNLISQDTALAVAGLDKQLMKQAAELITAHLADSTAEAGDLDAAVKEFACPAAPPRQGFRGMSVLVKSLRQALVDFGDENQLLEIRPRAWQQNVELLKDAPALIGRIIECVEGQTAT